MKKLSTYLLKLRTEQERSLRWVERSSRKKYPKENEKTISNGYLFQLEAGTVNNPHPMKLKTLSEVYSCNYITLLKLAGYLEESNPEHAFDSKVIKAYEALSPDIQNHVLRIMQILGKIDPTHQDQLQ